MRSQGTVREWDGMDKRDQGYSRPGTGGMSHGIPGHPTAKSDNPQTMKTISLGLKYTNSIHFFKDYVLHIKVAIQGECDLWMSLFWWCLFS